MNDKQFLEELREIAFHLRIDPIGTTGHAASVSTILKAIAGMQESFKNFIKTEALKNSPFKAQFQNNP